MNVPGCFCTVVDVPDECSHKFEFLDRYVRVHRDTPNRTKNLSSSTLPRVSGLAVNHIQSVFNQSIPNTKHAASTSYIDMTDPGGQNRMYRPLGKLMQDGKRTKISGRKTNSHYSQFYDCWHYYKIGTVSSNVPANLDLPGKSLRYKTHTIRAYKHNPGMITIKTGRMNTPTKLPGKKRKHRVPTAIPYHKHHLSLCDMVPKPKSHPSVS